MPKYYCEYCDIYLTHSSPAGRRQHNSGRKHINNKIEYYQNLIRDPSFVPPEHIDPNATTRGPFMPGIPPMGMGVGFPGGGGIGATGMMRPPPAMMLPPGGPHQMGMRPPMNMPGLGGSMGGMQGRGPRPYPPMPPRPGPGGMPGGFGMPGQDRPGGMSGGPPLYMRPR